MRLVGRDTEVSTLTKTLDQADQIVLLRGEAGIGKSRLAEDTLDTAAARGLTIFRGQAHPLHAGLAYAPIVEAVRPHASTQNTALGTLLGHQGAAGDPDLNRTRMFEAVARLVQEKSPAVFFVDDLHWADRGTIELVHYLAKNTCGTLILAAYRPGEANPALDELAATVRRTGTELELAPLTDDHVATLAHDLLDAPPEPAFLSDVVQRAKGIPLFVTALVQGGLQAVPTIVRDVVLSRLRQLDEPGRKLMEIVAVAGESATDAVLRAVAAAPDVLRNLILEGLVVERPVGRAIAYRVAHPLYAEVAYAEMTISERRTLHSAVLTAIEQHDASDVLALAPHYREAGSIADPARAVAVMAEAGERAMTVRASEEAVRYFEAALDLAEPEQALDLLDGIGRAQRALGAMDQAKAAWSRGIKLAEQHRLAKPLALFRFRVAMLDTEWQDTPPAEDGLLAVREVSVDSAELAIQTFVYTMWHGSMNDAKDLTTALAQQLNTTDPSASRAVAHHGRAIALIFDQQFGPAHEQAEAAVDAARQCDNTSPFYLQFFLIAVCGFRALSGDIAGAVRGAQEAVQAGAVVELPSLTWVNYHTLACCHYLAGDFNEAMAQNDTSVAAARMSGLPRAIAGTVAMRAFLLAERGQLSDAATALAEARQAYPDPDHSLVDVIGLAATAIALYVDEPQPMVPYVASTTYSDPFSVLLRGLYASLAALNVGDPSLAVMHSEAIGAFKQPAPLMTAFDDRLTGLRLGDAKLLADAAERFAAVGAKVLAAQTRLEYSELTNSADGLPEIVEVLSKAGAAHWANRARQHARALGMRLSPTRQNGPLTARETDVLRLLSDGLSNADIAARLFLSGRTVETHLRNSYAKLGLSTRVALARWASENL
ncbi:ATP-binding protein [Kibdelosporangium philippinense]|uniref:ATP-binding protein n=1 Tax=Kibdelosporangium philippinense TaxID=211113 RepID=UPI0024C3B85D|nr:LuxR family transcriptional regulator [Kibdelosporangium philippinense]